MDCVTFKENMDLLDELLEGRDKSKEVLMVCTGGIRCSVSGRYLRQKGFEDVKMVNRHGSQLPILFYSIKGRYSFLLAPIHILSLSLTTIAQGRNHKLREIR
jgi:hypothetical protein